jgi:Flp pilus assembly protein TadD
VKKAVLIVTLVAVVTICFWFQGRPVYRHFRERRAIEQARRFVERADFGNASLSARRALYLNPANIEGCKIMAQLAELAGAPQVVDWRRRIVELSPTTDNKLDLASAAERFEAPPYAIAAQVVSDLEKTANGMARFHAVAADLAVKLGQFEAAEHHFEQAVQLEPTNDLHRLNLAILRLGSEPTPADQGSRPAVFSWDSLLVSSGDEEREVVPSPSRDKYAEARVALETLRTNSAYSVISLRALAGDALKRKDFSDARRFSSELVAHSQARLDDFLRHLSILRELKAEEFASTLESLQSHVGTDARGIYAVALWMSVNGLAAEATSWLNGLPTSIRAQTPVGIAMAQAFVARRDWNGAETFLAGQTWGELEFLRFAWLSRAAWEQKRPSEAESHWRLALRQAGERLGLLRVLLRMAESCGQERGREDVLWRIVQRSPKEKWVSRELHKLFVTDGNTVGLNRLYEWMADCDSKDWVARNNFAATSMLLGLNLAKAHQFALQLYREKPNEPILASTYAYSLHLQGRTKDALAVLEKCPAQALADPAVALYYGVLLSADGRTNEAAGFLNIARNGELLPEERRMVAGVGQ